MRAAQVKTLLSLWRSAHPGPTAVVTVLAAALGFGVGLSPWRIALLAAAVFAGQLSVGISNDAIDAERDRAVGRQDKPIACGELRVRTAWIAAVGCLAAALILSAPLGPGLLGAHAVVLVSAWSYNAGLKSTALSVLPYIITFGLFPSLATLSAPQPQLAAPWAWIAGGILGIALHLTNVLPDLDDDARTGVRGLPHRLGGRVSAAVASVAVLLGAAAVTVGPLNGRILEVPSVFWVFFAAVVGVALATLILNRAGRSGRVLFRLVMLAAMLLTAQLVAAGGSLAG